MGGGDQVFDPHGNSQISSFLLSPVISSVLLVVGPKNKNSMHHSPILKVYKCTFNISKSSLDRTQFYVRFYGVSLGRTTSMRSEPNHIRH